MCDIVHYENSDDGQAATNLQFLEAAHIFAVSNMVRRPIIILSEDVIRNKVGEAISVNDLFGIYLPILSSPSECIKEPVVLAYDRSHFCPLQTSEITREQRSDNILPLYPSINHIYEQTLLPIRFLGDDVTAERSDNLLHEYLKIVKIDFTFDSKSPAIPVTCAELGAKTLGTRDNFFLLYYKYLTDFFEIQKPRAIEEERRRERERLLDEYGTQQTSYYTRSRSMGRPDTSLTTSPRLGDTTNNTGLRNVNTRIGNQQYSFDDLQNNGAYIPPRSGMYIEKPRVIPQSSQTLPSYARTTQRDLTLDNTSYTTPRQPSSTSYSDNIDNVNGNGKLVNSFTTNINGKDSSFSQGNFTRSDKYLLYIYILSLTLLETGGLSSIIFHFRTTATNCC